jgi:LCP family protein required for cell wall assembly
MHIARPIPPTRRGCLFWAVAWSIGLFAACGLCALVYVLLPLPSYNVLVLGLDARPGEGSAARTDSIIVAGVNTSTFQVSALSVPRDLFIPVRGYSSSQRVNTIYLLGEMEAAGHGLALAKESIGTAFSIPVERTVLLNFEGFAALVDAVGGVEVYVERNIVDYNYPTADGGVETFEIGSGWQTLDGATALKYARTRYTDDDYARARRQQQIVRGLLIRLANPANWQNALWVWSRYVSTDVSIGDMLVMAPAVLLSRGELNTFVIDRDYILPGQQGAIPNTEKLAPILQQYFRGG